MTDTIESLSKRVAQVEAFIAGLRAYLGGSAPGGGIIATATDLDGRYGDPTVKVTPRDWKGIPRKGERMSRCEPEFLDMLAETLEHFASKNDASGAKASNGKPKSFYDRADAARARGWAKRLREGWKAPQAAAGPATHSRGWGTSGWGANSKHTGTPEQSALIDDPYAPREGEPPMSEDDGIGGDDEIPF